MVYPCRKVCCCIIPHCISTGRGKAGSADEFYQYDSCGIAEIRECEFGMQHSIEKMVIAEEYARIDPGGGGEYV